MISLKSEKRRNSLNEVMGVYIGESKCICPICKQWDNAKNMVPAEISGVTLRDDTNKIHQNATWFGQAHLKCIEKYNESREPKYSIREYDEKDKFLGNAPPI